MNYNLIFIVATVAFSTVDAGLSPELQDECLQNPLSNVNAMLDLPSIDTSFLKNIRGTEDIGSQFVDFLKSASLKFQAPIVSAIKAVNPDTQTQGFWGANRIALKNVSCSKVAAISLIPGIMNVRKEGMVQLHAFGTAVLASSLRMSTKAEVSPQWGVAKINAPQIWNVTKGAGVVVASIDSGVLGTHEALVGNWRGGDYSWLDGVTNSSQGIPNDGNGHGTHTMGTICGQKGIGVAPDAQWIACKGCNEKGQCAEGPLITCGQWIMCPYQTANGEPTKDCSKKPNVVNNSWGGAGGSFYNEVIVNWQKAGIIPVVSAGNSGPFCYTTGSPGDQDNVISIGATDSNDDVADFSSRGPSLSTFAVKPEVSAPGVKIRSAWNTGNSTYADLDGTSMAAPHVTGATALLLAKTPTLTYQQILKALETTAVQPSAGNTCDICSCSLFNPFCCLKKKWPNNSYGYGRIDALAAFNTV